MVASSQAPSSSASEVMSSSSTSSEGGVPRERITRPAAATHTPNAYTAFVDAACPANSSKSQATSGGRRADEEELIAWDGDGDGGAGEGEIKKFEMERRAAREAGQRKRNMQRALR